MQLHRARRLAGVIFFLLAGAGGGWLACGPGGGQGTGGTPQEEAAHRVRALRFAGTDLVYALRRIAAEAHMLLALDEIEADPMTPDLARFRIDMDLPAGPLEDMLEKLEQETKAFDFRISDNVVYVRSALTVTTTTTLDIKNLPAQKITVDLEELMRWIMRIRPRSFISNRRTGGEPIFQKVELDIPENSSILEVLLMYAKKVDRGWRMHRAGQHVKDAQGRAGIVASNVALWPPLDQPGHIPEIRQRRSTIDALAKVARRTGEVICIRDRTVLGNIRGSLDFGRKNDPGKPIEESLRSLAWGGAQTNLDLFEWERQDGIIKITSQHYRYYLTGRDLLEARVKAGTFEGTLPELARWINRNRTEPAAEVLMGGEITGEGPKARLEIEAGAAVEDVLDAFARTARAGWNLVIVAPLTPDEESKPLPPGAWKGAYLTPLGVWER